MFSASVITAPLPIRLSVRRLPQSWGFDDGVLYFGVTDCCVISDARVWADEGVETNLAMVSDYDGGSHCCAAVDDLARAENAPF